VTAGQVQKLLCPNGQEWHKYQYYKPDSKYLESRQSYFIYFLTKISNYAVLHESDVIPHIMKAIIVESNDINIVEDFI
jgi:hypothetical protein